MMKIRKSGRDIEWIKEMQLKQHLKTQQELSMMHWSNPKMITFLIFQNYVDIFSWKSGNEKFWWKSGNPEEIYWMNQGSAKQFKDNNESFQNAWKTTISRVSKLCWHFSENLKMHNFDPEIKIYWNEFSWNSGNAKSFQMMKIRKYIF